MINKLNLLFNFDLNTKEVIKNASASLIIKVVGVGLLFFNSAFLGRFLGPEGLGIINISLKITAILLMLSLLGIPHLLVKEISIYHSNKNWNKINDLSYSSFLLNIGASTILALIIIYFTPYLSEVVFNESELSDPLRIILIGMIPQAFIRIVSSLVLGFHKVWQSNLLSETLGAFGVSILLLLFYLSNIEITIIKVAYMYATTYLVVSICSFYYWKSIFNYKTDKRKKGAKISKLIVAAVPFLLVNGSGIIASNTDVLMVGWLTNAYNAGLYSVAVQVALVTSFFLLVTNSALSPKLAAMFAKGEIVDMNKMVQKITLGLLAFGLLFTLFFVFFGKYILSMWGDSFIESYQLLVILSIGQFFNIGTGCAGFLLIMCGHEKIHAILSLSFVFINIVLNYVLITTFGVIGAAVATAITVGAENILKVVLAYKKVGVSTIKFRK